MSAFERIANGQPACMVQAALEFAVDEYPQLQVGCYVERMHALCAEFLEQCPGSCPHGTLECLNEFFFERQKFSGNTSTYYDPRNSYLNEVIDRRLGIPISLSALYKAIARAAGIQLVGINIPGHFMLALQPADAPRTYIDVFNGGEMLSWDQCRERLLPMLGPDGHLTESDLPAMNERQILIRMLRNLKGIYSRLDRARCLRIQKRLLQLLPGDPMEMRDLAFMFFHTGKPLQAMRALETLLERYPHFHEDAEIAEYLAKASQESALLN